MIISGPPLLDLVTAFLSLAAFPSWISKMRFSLIGGLVFMDCARESISAQPSEESG